MVLRKNARAVSRRRPLSEEDENTRTIDLKKIRFDKADADLLESIKKSGTSEHKSYASLVRLYVRMGLTLRRQKIYTVEQLEVRLAQAAQQASPQQLDELKRYIDEKVALTVEQREKKKPRSK
jgi:hypothetical protein